LCVPLVAPVGLLYLVGVLLVGGLLFCEHCVIRPADLSKIHLAFFTVNGFVGLVFMGLTLADILLRRLPI
jgi:4-hydroxybenzoate polyprenyltransferase